MTVSFTLTPEQEQLKAVARQFADEHLRDLSVAVRAEPDPLTRAMLRPPDLREGGHGRFPQGPDPGAVRWRGGQRGRRRDLHRGVGRPQPGLRDLDGRSADRPGAGLRGGHPGADPALRRPVPGRLRRSGRRHGLQRARGQRQLRRSPPGQGIRTTAEPDGEEWVVNGRKAWASHLSGWDGDGPDIMTIVCRTPGGVSLIVAEREHLAGRIEVEEHYDLPGLRLPDVARRAARRARPARRTSSAPRAKGSS